MQDKELIISSQDIAARTCELGREISDHYAGKKLLVVGVLNGAFMFTADLVRAISIDHEIDFIRVASYGSDTSSSGKILLSKDLEITPQGKDILLVEDIIDTGLTVSWLHDYLLAKNPVSLKTCSLIDKTERRKAEVTIDFCGFKVGKGFLVGYGLDCAERYRHLPDIYHLHEK